MAAKAKKPTRFDTPTGVPPLDAAAALAQSIVFATGKPLTEPIPATVEVSDEQLSLLNRYSLMTTNLVPGVSVVVCPACHMWGLSRTGTKPPTCYLTSGCNTPMYRIDRLKKTD